MNRNDLNVNLSSASEKWREALIKMKEDHANDWNTDPEKIKDPVNVGWGRLASDLINGLTRPSGISLEEQGDIDNEIEQLTKKLELHSNADFNPIQEQCVEIIRLASPILATKTDDRLKYLVEVCNMRKSSLEREFGTGEEELSPISLGRTSSKNTQSPSDCTLKNQLQVRRLLTLSNDLIGLVIPSEKTNYKGEKLPEELHLINEKYERLIVLKREISKLESQLDDHSSMRIDQTIKELLNLADEIIVDLMERRANLKEEDENLEIEDIELFLLERVKRKMAELKSLGSQASIFMGSNIHKSKYLTKEKVKTENAKIEMISFEIRERHDMLTCTKEVARTARTNALIELPEEVFSSEHRTNEALVLDDLGLIVGHLLSINTLNAIKLSSPFDFTDPEENNLHKSIKLRLVQSQCTIRHLLFHMYEGKRADSRIRETIKEIKDISLDNIVDSVITVFKIVLDMNDNHIITEIEFKQHLGMLKELQKQLYPYVAIAIDELKKITESLINKNSNKDSPNAESLSSFISV